MAKPKKETYEILVLCNNCRHGFSGQQKIQIEKGKPVESGLKDKRCPNCGCLKLVHLIPK